MVLASRAGGGVCALLALLLSSSAAAQSQEEASEPVEEEQAFVAPEKHYWRALLQEALAIGGGTAWYWIDRERQVADWDFPSWRDRLTLDVIRYDNNPFHVNFAWHAGNGSGFHVIARTNGLSYAEALGYGVLTSLMWEYALEYREKVSFNDLIFTTGAGLPLGEFIHVMGSYLNEDPEASQWQAARWTLGFPQALNNVIEGGEAPALMDVSRLWHDFHLGYDLSFNGVDRNEEEEDFALHTLHIDGSFVRLPGYRETGVWGRFFHGVQFNRASFDASGTRGGSGFKLFAESTLLGYYQQQIHADPDFLSNSTMVGVALGYRYRREEVGLWDDRVAALHLPGLAMDARLQWRELSLDARLRVHADFAGVNALSNAEWNEAYPNEQGKTILRKMGYYYGFGASASAEAELRYRDVVLGASLWAGRYESDEGLDRIQEDVTVDQEARDEILDGRLFLRLEGLPRRSYVGLSAEYRRRDAVLEEFRAEASLLRLGLQLGLRL